MVGGFDREEEKMIELSVVVVENEKDMAMIEKRLEDFEIIKKAIKNKRLSVSSFIEYFLLDASNTNNLNEKKKQFFIMVWDTVDGVDMSTQVMDTPITTIISKFISTVRELHDLNVFHGGFKKFLIFISSSLFY